MVVEILKCIRQKSPFNSHLTELSLRDEKTDTIDDSCKI